MTENRAYSFDGKHETSISEEDDKDRNAEVAGEHVHDVWLVVVARSQGVVVRATGNLYSLWNIPGKYGREPEGKQELTTRVNKCFAVDSKLLN